MQIVAIRLLRRSLAVVLVVCLGWAIGLVALAHAGPHLGWTPLFVRGSAMEPALPHGSLAVAVEVEARAVAVGDVVAIQSADGRALVRRVSDIGHEDGQAYFVAHPDAAREAQSEQFGPASLLGRVAFVMPLAGTVSEYLATPVGLAACLALMGLLLMAVWRLDDGMAMRQRPLAERPARRIRTVGG